MGVGLYLGGKRPAFYNKKGPSGCLSAAMTRQLWVGTSLLPLVLAAGDDDDGHDHGDHGHGDDGIESYQHASNAAVLAHGGLMILAWVLLIPVGILVANFCRAESYWLPVHRATQSISVLLTTIGTIVIIAGVSETGGHHFIGAHTFIGIVITVLAIMQPINAFMRPPSAEDGMKKSDKRSTWEKFHKASGYILLLLGIVNCFLGLFRSNPAVQNILLPVLGLFVVGLIAASFILGLRADAAQQQKQAAPSSVPDTKGASNVKEAEISPEVAMTPHGDGESGL